MRKFVKVISVLLVITFLVSILQINVFAKEHAGKTPPLAKTEKTLTPSIQDTVAGNVYSEADSENGKLNLIREVEEKREENVKHFLTDQMTFAAVVYPGPVHYMDGDKWKDIDNRIVEQKDEYNNDVLENKANDFKVRIAKSISSNKLVSIKKDKYEISWSLVGDFEAHNKNENVTDAVYERPEVDNGILKEKAQAKAKKLNSSALVRHKNEEQANYGDYKDKNLKKTSLSTLSGTVEFENIYENVDLQYQINSKELKENIIIKKRGSQSVFTFRINADRMNAVLNEDKSITFYDGKDSSKKVYLIEAPFMYDSKGVQSKDVDVEFQKSGKSYVMTLRPSIDWLESEERAYPVVVDPYITLNHEDTYVLSEEPDKNNVYAQTLCVSDINGNSTTNAPRNRVYVKFNLPKFEANDLLTGAYYVIYTDFIVAGGKEEPISVHKVLTDWDPKTITWNTQPSYEARAESVVMFMSRDNDEYASEMWNILDMVNDWYKNGNNYGLMLKYLRKNENIAPQGYSSGVSTSFRSTNFYKYDPQVILYYVNNSGLEDYWTYHSQSLGRAGTGYVNNSSGNLVFIHNDVTTTGYKSNLILNHVYNNKRWRLSLKQTIEKETIENELYYIYTDEDGTKHYFKGTGKDQSGLNLYLSKLSDGSFRIKDKKDNTLYFNDDGDLTSITNPVEGIVRVQYDGGSRIASVTDGAGRITKINYANSQLDNIVDPAGRITYFRYTNSKLTQIDYPDGKASKYSYNSDGLLETVTDCSGYKVTYLYNNSNPKRVNKIKESNSDGTLGNELSIVYGSKHTEFTDVKGRKYTYQFNDWGNTICVTDHEGNAQYYKYLRESNLNNKLSLQSKLQKSIVNYVKNHNAEADSAWVDSGDTGSTGSMSYDSTQKYLGKRSIKIIKTNTTNAKYAQQAIDLEKGKTYTFSAYIKTNGISSINKNGAALIAYYKNNADVWQSVCSKFVNGTNDWQRHEVSFTVPSDSSSNSVLIRLAIAGETGTAYFDCMQLESGLVANRYNILENSDMIYGTSIPDFWTTANCDSNDKLVNTAGELRPGNINSKCFKIKGYPKDEKYLEQKINTSIKKGDVFTFGAWIKQDSALKGAEIAIFFDNRYSSLGALKTNTCFTGWQYVSDRIVAGLDSSNITLRITYKDANEAYFDGIQLCKEEFGVSYQYDDEGNVVSTVDLAEQNSKFEYNSTNDLIKTVSPKGNEFRYEYNTLHQMEKAITAENIRYLFEYSSTVGPTMAQINDYTNFIKSYAGYSTDKNYLSWIKDPSGNKVTYNYHPTKGVLGSITDAKSKTTYYHYDTMDKLTMVEKAVDGVQVANSYGYKNDYLETITHNGFSYKFDYDSLGNNTKFSVGKQALIANTLEPRTGMLKEATYGNGQKTVYGYDNLDRIKEKKHVNTARYKYDYSQNKTWTYRGFNIPVDTSANYKFSFDVYISKDADINTTGTTFVGNLEKGLSRGFYYDNTKKGTWQHLEFTGKPTGEIVTALIYPCTGTSPATKGHIVFRDVKFEKVGTAENLFTQVASDSEFKYRGSGTYEVITDYAIYKYDYSQNKTWTYHGFKIPVDTSVNYTFSLDAYISPDADIPATGTTMIADIENGLSAFFYYDNTKKGTWQHFEFTGKPTGTTANAYIYPSTGTSPATKGYIKYENVRFTKAGTPNNLFPQVVNNSDFQIKGNGVFEARRACSSYSYEYDANGNVGLFKDEVNDVSYRYYYDMAERLSKLTDSNGNFTEYSYDLDNNLSQVRDRVNGIIYTRGYTYDKDSRIKTVTANNGSTTTYNYDMLNRLKNYIVNTGSYQYTTSLTYEKGDYGTGSTTNRLKTINNNGNTIDYTYDENGNISSITQSGKKINYLYNELNEVVRENNQVLNKTITYQYDAGGNILNKKEYAYTTSYTLSTPVKTVNYGYDSVWKDKLISYNGKSISYDSIGNPTSDGTYTYEWEMGRQLKSISKAGQYISFRYNDAGIRNQKFANNVLTQYYLSGDRVVFETNGTDKIYYTYGSGDKLVSMNLNGVEYYYLRNGQGDITGLFDGTGSQVVSYSYDTWGKLLSVSGNLASTVGQKNPYRYRGYRYDTETGLYYLQSRYYNPEWGRFINADTIMVAGPLLSGNLFAYCVNNPVNKADPSGKIAIVDDLIIIGILVLAAGVCVAADDAMEGPITHPQKWFKMPSFSMPYSEGSSTALKTNKKTLADVKAKQPSKKVYFLAYVNEDTGALVPIGKPLSYAEALVALGTTATTNAAQKALRKSVDSLRSEHPDLWGVYTHDQIHAKALAMAFGGESAPEVHGGGISGFYGHYHDGGHNFHVWYGGQISY